MKDFDTNNGVTYNLVQPGMNRRNAAERCIRTFKNHFVSGLISTDDIFPLHLWDWLLPQATITPNMLRASLRNPIISAYMVLEGLFDYNKTPLAPPGTKVVINEYPDKRASWEAHGVYDWYLGPALEHYRCYRVYVNNTCAEQNADTVEFSRSTQRSLASQQTTLSPPPHKNSWPHFLILNPPQNGKR